MRLKRIKILAIVIPAVGLAGFEAFRHFVLQPAMGEPGGHVAEHIISGGVLLVAVVAFSLAIFRLLERLHDQLVALNEAAIAVTGDLSVDRVLERVAELAREVAGAQYASVRVGGESERVVSSGVEPPGGQVLALPIVVKGSWLGELVLSDPPRGRLRASDRRALETFATQAGIALENARLFEQVDELVAARERARIGMDLHDGVIQELYAVGLRVEDAAELAPAEPVEAAAMMRGVQDVLRRVIGEIRTYIYGLRDGDSSVELGPALERLAAEFPSADPTIRLDLADDVRLPATLAANLLHIVREAVANALRHARPSKIVIRTSRRSGDLTLSVEDDGTGFDPSVPANGFGIPDMRERAQWCRCPIRIRSAPGGGTVVEVGVPVESASRQEATA